MAVSPVDDLLSRLEAVTPAGDGKWKACCPAHEDRNPSLSISAGEDGTALVRCWAGCETESVCQAVGLSMADLFSDDRPGASSPRPAPTKRERKPDATWPTCNEALRELDRRESRNHRQRVRYWTYYDASGSPLGVVVRYETADGNKAVIPISKQPDGPWAIKAMPTPRLLYQLPTLADAERVYVCEGEKAADAVRGLGLVATTSPGGCKAARKSDWSPLAGKTIIILPDHDEPGERYADDVRELLAKLTPVPSVKIVRLPDLPAGGDAVEWIGAGGTREQLDAMGDDAQPMEIMAATDGLEPWPDLVPFIDERLPAFPTQSLPEPLREWVEAVAHSTQVPADLPALLSLAVCSCCLSRKVSVVAGWEEPTNLFVAVLLAPGNRKSAVFRDCLAPLEEIETALIESERANVARAQSERRQREKRLTKLERQAGESGDAEARHEASELSAELATEIVPALPRLIADNATSEKLESLLSEQGGRILSASAEGGVFDLMAGMYSKSGTPQIDVYLKGHAADDLRTDRVGRESVRISKPTLTCAYAVQPEVIRGLSENRAMAGRGLWARFLFAMPTSNVGWRLTETEPVPESIRQAYRDAVQRLYYNTQADTVLRLSPNAATLFSSWKAEAEVMLRDGADLENLKDWGLKLPGATLRIAAVLHSVEHGAVGEIGSESIQSAIEIARYLIPHAEAVLTMASAASATISDAQYVLRWIERHEREAFSKSESQHHGKRRFPKANDIDAPLIELQRRGYIRKREEKPTGPGRPAEEFEVNPSLMQNESVRTRSRNSQNPPEERGEPNIGNNGSAFQGSEIESWEEI